MEISQSFGKNNSEIIKEIICDNDKVIITIMYDGVEHQCYGRTVQEAYNLVLSVVKNDNNVEIFRFEKLETP